MRKVVVLLFLSLDGVAEEPSDWFFDDGPELLDLIREVIGTQDDVLLGRGTYEYWAGYWPTSDLEPFAPFINAVPKHVATSSELTSEWSNTVVMSAPVLDHVSDLKAQPGGDIGVHGSIELARGLISAGLVDELRFVIPPTVAGHGKRLFDADAADEMQRFELVGIETSAKGTLFSHYRTVSG
jgi:dihydrofolate reductase